MTGAQKGIAVVGLLAILALLAFVPVRRTQLETDASRQFAARELLALKEGSARPERSVITINDALASLTVPLLAVVAVTGLGVVLAAPKR